MIMTSHNGASDNGVKIVDPHGSMMMQDWESFASATVNAGDVEDLVQDEVMKVQVALLFLPFNSADPVTQFSPITGECIPTASLTSMLEEKLGISKHSHLNCSRRESILNCSRREFILRSIIELMEPKVQTRRGSSITLVACSWTKNASHFLNLLL